MSIRSKVLAAFAALALFVAPVYADGISGGVGSSDGISGGIGSGDGQSGARPFQIPGSTIDASFASNQFAGDTLANIVSNSNSTGGYAQDTSGNWTLFGPNTLRRTNRGILIEESRTNQVANSSNTGSVVGSPGTPPNGWSLGTNTSIVGKGTENGIDYVDVQFNGTAATDKITFSGVSIPAVQGNIVAVSVFVRLIAGDLTNVNAGTFCSDEFTVGFGYLSTDCSQRVNFASGTLGMNRPSASYTIQNATTASLNLYLNIGMNAAAPYNFTLRLGWPQLEIGKSTITSPIRTTGTATARSADNVTIGGKAAATLNAAIGTAAVTTAGGSAYSVAANIIDSAAGTPLLGFTSADLLTDTITAGLTTTNLANRIAATDYSVVAWNAGGRTLVLNGQAAATDATAQTPSATLHLGSTGAANFINAYVSRLTLWNTKLASPAANFPLVTASNVIGANISGPEFAPVNGGYGFPTAGNWTYLAGKGVKLVRLPLAWENIQPTLLSPLSSAYVTSVLTAMSQAAAAGIAVIPDLHNFGCYADNTVWNTSVQYAGNAGTVGTHIFAIGSVSLPLADYTDVLTRMATAFKGAPGYAGLEIMNEPTSSITPASWQSSGQAAINTIRAVDPSIAIYVQPVNNINGGGYNANDWRPQVWTGTGIVYDGHVYFDAAQNQTDGGQFTQRFLAYGQDTTNGLIGTLPFINWLKSTGNQGIIGEFNVDGPASCTLCTIAANVLTVGGTVVGIFDVGKTIVVGAGVTANSQITSLGTGTGGAGTYNLSQSSTVSSGEAMSVAINTSSNWYLLNQKVLALMTQSGVAATIWEFPNGNASGLALLNQLSINPQGGVDDIRLTALSQKF